MENPILELKKDIIRWVEHTDDLEMLCDIHDKINPDFNENSVREPHTKYALKDDFEERWVKGIPHNEMKQRTIDFVNSLPWKK